MWPLDLPAAEVLRLPGDTVVPWAVFDAAWYSATYPDAAATEPAALRDHYLRFGQSLGYSPNRLFDEAWHRRRYPQIADRIIAGDYTSAFDAYCRRGALDRSGHWLFDELIYRDRYPDLTTEVFAAAGIVNGYDHYLRHGGDEDRIGHKLFDPLYYLSHFALREIPAIRQSGIFRHYLARIESGGAELRTSIYFDPAWYLSRYPEVARGIEAKRWKCALQHYLCNDTPAEFDPSESFSEAWYVHQDPGLRQAIASHSFRNGYMHFLRFGAVEKRSASPSVDLSRYARQPAVAADLSAGRMPDAYTHWLTAGAPPAARRDATALLPIAGRFGYHFDGDAEPIISVVIVVTDGFATTMETIATLRASTASRIELIVVDCGSADETRSLGRYVPGAKILRFEQKMDWPSAADAGRQCATAPAILFLSGVSQIAYGSLDRAAGRLVGDASVAAVGGLVLQPHGVVAQAGGILWNDGNTADYQREASPLAPEVNFVRDVDFCAFFLLVRTGLLSELDGLDQICRGNDIAVDLCLRTAQAGFRVVYDPSVLLVLSEAAPPAEKCGQHFRRKHAAALASRLDPGEAALVFARHAGPNPPGPNPPGPNPPGPKPHRVLFIEDTVPLRRIGSGFVRANDLIRTMTSFGCCVTVFPVNGCDHDLAHVFGDMPETVEVMHDLGLRDLDAFLGARACYYDTVWVARTHNLALVRPMLAQLQARVVLDTEAVAPQRSAMQAALAGEPYNLDAAMHAVLADAAGCHSTVAVTQAEAATLCRFGFPAVAVIGHMIEPRPTERLFARRSGMLFVGAIHTPDSPNLDSLTWFIDQVLPLVEAELKWETRLTIAGYVVPGVGLDRFERHPRITLLGSVADLQPVYDAHRVFVAPTRYAAGAPYKVLEAASRGVPVVATDLLREQLGWMDGAEIRSARADDPAAFAAHAVALYRDEALWQRVRDAALHRVRQEYGAEDYARAIREVLRQ